MKIDIWSDIRCPFCYIGKRKFEDALSQFAHKNEVEVNWRSFELDPDLKTQPGLDMIDFFTELKGLDRENALQMHEQLSASAKEVGIDFNFDKAVVANSFKAHRLIQLAKSKNLAPQAEEVLFEAYFCNGINIDDDSELLQLGMTIGLPKEELEKLFASDAYAQEVRQDELQANLNGVRGVPFFTFDSKYAVSGAQPSAAFLQVLEEVWKESEGEGKQASASEGESYTPDGNCE